MKTLQHLLFCIMVFATSFCTAQQTEITEEMKENVILYNAKINELIEKNLANGFDLVKEEKLPMRNNIDLILHVNLREGNLYRICFVGDPGSVKVKTTLFLEGIGDIVQDRIKVRRENEFWTEFSFLCPQTGNYELSLLQKSSLPRPLSYMMIFRKKREALKPTG